jgi:hypothetical protein
MALQVINPLNIPNWDDLVLATGQATVFHSSGWARVLHESYGYTPVYFTSIENGKIASLMPVMEVHSVITGKRGVSLPFTDCCDSIAPSAGDFKSAVEGVKQFGKERGWRRIEWRGNGELFNGALPSSTCYSHTLNLNGGEAAVFSKFKGSTRRNINKALKEGVGVGIEKSPEAMAAYYRLHCGTRKDHGLPPQPSSFFERIFEHLIRPDKGFVVLARLEEACIAGAVYLHFGDSAVYKFGASDKKFQHLRPNNLVMWEGIRESMSRGCRSFSFGRTEQGNEGLLQFKRGWGTKEERVAYHRYDLHKNSFEKETMGVKGFHNRIFEMAPIPLLRLLGWALYKHLG